MTHPHTSVLLQEFLSFFADRSVRRFVDGTLGAGGHAEALLRAHPEIELFVGIDQDLAALEIARARLEPWKDKVLFLQGNFEGLAEHLKANNIHDVDGILVDLGVSSMQFDQPERGFSFSKDGPLDMRMNSEGDLTAAEVVNSWSEDDLGRVFREYGEEKQWRRAAKAVVAARAQRPILTTGELADVLRPVFPPRYDKKKVNPLTLVFQGLRICVNRELEVLEAFLPRAVEALCVGGRLGIISFHSLEDRIVKQYFRQAADDKQDTSGGGMGLFLDKDPTVKLLTRKPLSPSDEEQQRNPRSRSAKLRFIEKL